jgi:hypothetical protein
MARDFQKKQKDGTDGNSAYGNLYFNNGDFDNARHEYKACDDIASVEFPIHPITCSGYYSLGCTEFVMGHNGTVM